MKPFSKTHIILSVATFVALFLMNYLGSTDADRLSRAIMNGAAGVIGLGIGLFILYKNKDGGKGPDFD